MLLWLKKRRVGIGTEHVPRCKELMDFFDVQKLLVFSEEFEKLRVRRRTNGVRSGLQESQQRSQQSQQSLSQGFLSQPGMLSHLSQNSLDEAVTNDQRFGSQDPENSLRKINSTLPRLSYSREESQPPNSKSSSNVMVKWNPPSDHKSQLSEGVEHRVSMMETSLSRFAMILDSVQSDIMQVNKGTKEVILEMECIRQKLIAQDNSLQLMTKGQEEIKASIDGSLKSISEQMSKVTNQEKLQEVYLVVSALPQLIKASLQSLQNDLHNTTTEMQEISCSLKSVSQKDLAQSLSTKSICNQFIGLKKRQPSANETTMSLKTTVAPETETGGWKLVKKERANFSDRISEKVCKQNEPSVEKFVRGGRDYTIVIESDEDEGFSCLVDENAGEDVLRNFTKEEEEETKRILQRARRRKRKCIVML